MRSWQTILSCIALLALQAACSGSVDEDSGIIIPRDATTSDAAADIDASEDAAVEDDAAVDAGVDAGEEPDAEPEDAEAEDAEPEDGDAPDLGADAGDTGFPDPPDAASPDAMADAGPADTGVDAGPRDAGPDAGVACNSTFGMANACGGNPVGNWTYRDVCTDRDPFAPVGSACPGSTPGPSTATVNGTLALNANNTFARNVSGTYTSQYTVPMACANMIGGSCAGFATALMQVVPGLQATCTPSGGNCDCTFSQSTSFNDSGTWTTSNGVITATAMGVPRNYYYCVNNNTLMYRGTMNNPQDNTLVYLLTP